MATKTSKTDQLEKGINSSTGKVHWARRQPHESPKLRKAGETVLVQACGMNRSVGSGGQHAYLSEVNDSTVAISCGRCAKAHGPGDIEVRQTKSDKDVADDSRVECPACEQQVKRLPSGRLASHKDAGERCPGKVTSPKEQPSSAQPVGSTEPTRSKTAKQPAKKAAKKQPQNSTRPTAAGKGTDTTTGTSKVVSFAQKLNGLGWDTEFTPTPNAIRATRSQESINIEWSESAVFLHASYTDHNGRTVKLRNASAALQTAARSEDKAQQEASRKASGKQRVGRPKKSRGDGALPSDEVPGANLPFHKDSMPHEIMEAIVGRAIEWSNSISGKTQTAVVMPTPKNNIKPDRNGNQVVHFYGPDGQYAVRVSAIRSVGNKQVDVPTTEQRADKATKRK